jgi:hypothetical protein
MKIVEDYTDTVTNEMIDIVFADIISEYSIAISFNDQTLKIIDFKPFLSKSVHPSIAKYLNQTLFKSYGIKDGNLNWNDYDLIFPIYDLYTGKID